MKSSNPPIPFLHTFPSLVSLSRQQLVLIQQEHMRRRPRPRREIQTRLWVSWSCPASPRMLQTNLVCWLKVLSQLMSYLNRTPPPPI